MRFSHETAPLQGWIAVPLLIAFIQCPPDVTPETYGIIDRTPNEFRRQALRAVHGEEKAAAEAASSGRWAAERVKALFRGRAAQALGLLGADAKDAIPALVALLKSDASMESLFYPKSVVRPLYSVDFERREVPLRQIAAEALQQIDPKAAENIPELRAVRQQEQQRQADDRKRKETSVP